MAKKKIAESIFDSKLIHHFFLLLIPLALYIQTYNFDFTYHDDDSIVLNNYQTLYDFDLEKIFFTDAWMMKKQIELYRPFQSFTYAIDNFFTGKNASGYHLHNVLIFCLCIQLLYLFLLSLKIEETHSFFLSLIFSVHFLFAHTVSWIPARGDLYLFAFAVGSLITVYMYQRKQKTVYLLLAAVLYFLALLSKETAIVLMPLIYITGILSGELVPKKAKSYLLLFISVTLTAVYLYMRSISIFPVQNVFTLKGFFYNLPMIPEEVCKFYVPYFFSVMPAFSTTVTVIGFVLMIVLSVSVYYFRNTINKKLVFTGVAFFLLPLLPSLIYKPAFTGFAYDYLDHRMFFPGIGLLLISYSILFPLLKKKLSVYYLYGLVAALFFVAFINSKNYANYVSYYDNATYTNPKSGLAQSNYGASLARENKYDGALLHFNKAVAISPDNIEVRMKLADSYLYLNDYKKMREQCFAVIKINPKFPKSYYNIAVAFIRLKQNDSAYFYVNKAVEMDSTNADAFLYQGLIFNDQEHREIALFAFSKAIKLNNQIALAYFQRGNIYGNTGRYKEAFDDYDTYVKLVPGDGNAYFYRGQAYCLLGDKEFGCNDLHQALKMGVTEAQSKINYWCK